MSILILRRQEEETNPIVRRNDIFFVICTSNFIIKTYLAKDGSHTRDISKMLTFSNPSECQEHMVSNNVGVSTHSFDICDFKIR